MRARHPQRSRLCGRVAGEHIDEGLGLDNGTPVVGQTGQRHAEHGLVELGTQRRGIVREIVQDAQLLAHVKDRHPRLWRERRQVAHHLRAHHHALLRRCVDGVEHQGRDIARRAAGGIQMVAEEARRQRNRRFTCGRRFRHSVKVEKCDRPGFAFI